MAGNQNCIPVCIIKTGNVQNTITLDQWCTHFVFLSRYRIKGCMYALKSLYCSVLLKIYLYSLDYTHGDVDVYQCFKKTYEILIIEILSFLEFSFFLFFLSHIDNSTGKQRPYSFNKCIQLLQNFKLARYKINTCRITWVSNLNGELGMQTTRIFYSLRILDPKLLQ